MRELKERPIHAVIGVATYRRPDHLRRILPALQAEVSASSSHTQILIVDNDPSDGAAKAIVGDFGSPDVRYVHEPEPGISAARNRALVEAGTADVILFIDDDEMPHQGWLDLMLDCWSHFRCVAVAGPAVASFDGLLDPWVEASGVFDRWTFDTGTVVQGAASNNLLLDLGQLHALGVRFDPEFGISGGSDTMLTRTLSQRGGTLRWCDEAEVADLIPADRTTKRWVIRRIFRTSNTWSRVHLKLAPSQRKRFPQRVNLVLRGVLRMGSGLSRVGRGTLTGDLRMRATGTCSVVSGSGMVLGAAGYVWHEYRREGGSP